MSMRELGSFLRPRSVARMSHRELACVGRTKLRHAQASSIAYAAIVSPAPGTRWVQPPMSVNTVNAALRRLGYARDEMTGHGFRAMAWHNFVDQLGFTRFSTSAACGKQVQFATLITE